MLIFGEGAMEMKNEKMWVYFCEFNCSDLNLFKRKDKSTLGLRLFYMNDGKISAWFWKKLISSILDQIFIIM